MHTATGTIFYRRNLPHYSQKDAIYFITFRLAGSLPKEVILRLRENQCLPRIKHSRPSFVKFDDYLGSHLERPQWLKDPRIARLVADAIESGDKCLYTLFGYCIMANHVHMIIRPLDSDRPLCPILQLLKKNTALKANKVIGRSGQFWQHESYDHIVRNAAELERIMKYVWNNPVKAGLVSDASHWPWTSMRWELL